VAYFLATLYVHITPAYTGWPKKVSHYQESLSRIKNGQCGYISHQY